MAMVGVLILTLGCTARFEINPARRETPGPSAEKQQAPVASKRNGFVIPEENLKMPNATGMRACAENLRKIHRALEQYKKDKGKLPDWLCDLVPKYLSQETLFCPNDPDHTSPSWAFPDPKLRCSYCYEYSPAKAPSHWVAVGGMRMRDLKDLERRFFGEVVPIVRCFHHGLALNVAFNGQVYTSQNDFQKLFLPGYGYEMLFSGKQ
jgi:hypothetical protein